MATITIQEAQAKLPELIHSLSRGEEVVINENQRPIAKLVATEPQSRQTPKLDTQRGSVL